MAESVEKKGTCEPGQRADLTGCTPASGEGSQQKPSEEKPTARIKKPLSKKPKPPKISGRFETGKTLSKEQRKEVLKSVADVYHENGLEKTEIKGYDHNDDPIYGYPYSPELFVRSDITGNMVRYYITLPDGRKAHPSELYPAITPTEVEAAVSEEQSKAKQQEQIAKEKNTRITKERSQANALYQGTLRPLAYSFFMKNDEGSMVRVDGTDPDDVAHFAKQGFTQSSQPVPADDPESKEQARKVIKARVAEGLAVPEKVMADFPDIKKPQETKSIGQRYSEWVIRNKCYKCGGDV